MSAFSDDLALAHQLADLADAVTMPRFGAADLDVESKPDLTPVSDADLAVLAGTAGAAVRGTPRR